MYQYFYAHEDENQPVAEIPKSVSWTYPFAKPVSCVAEAKNLIYRNGYLYIYEFKGVN